MTEDALTFLFTDIEGSVRLWEERPEAMREALPRHDALLRAAIERQGGCVFKTAGGSFCAVFPEAVAACAAALETQASLQSAAWNEDGALRIRMALHTGDAMRREDDYFGPTLNRVARLLGVAHGGQVLLSGETHRQAQGRLPPDAALRDLGSHRLRDLQQPEHIWQLDASGLPDDFPPLQSLQAYANNLPQQMTSFIGREREMAEVKRLLTTTRLLTLTGAGGCGKTRLAMQAAADLLEQYPDGVWLVELAPIADPTLVPQELARVLGVREQAGRSLADAITDHLRTRSLMLLLDNCEHLLDCIATILAPMLRACPGLRVLATSREALNLTGETVWRVPSLGLPEMNGTPAVEDLARCEAVRLFVDRAMFGQPRFALTEQNAGAVAQVCRRLDGIPLAIELAAARVRVLTVEQIAARLDDRFRLLTGGSRASLPRQQTLRALIDWSYGLLKEEEKALLHRLSVFSGGWTLEAAEAVCAGSPFEDWEIPDLLVSLVDKSLVVAEEDGSRETRYRLMQTVRQYARELLQDFEEATDRLDRHRDWFLELAERAEAGLGGEGQVEWLDRLDTEHDNLRVALDRCLQTAPEGAFRPVGALWRFWSLRGFFSEGRTWLNRILQANEARAPSAGRARTLRAAGALASHQGDYPAALRFLRESLEIWEALDDPRGMAGTLNSLGNVAWRQGEYDQARDLYQRSLALSRELQDRSGIAVALISLGNVSCQQGDYQEACVAYSEALFVARSLGHREWEAAVLQNLGDALWRQEDYIAAGELYEQSLEIRRILGDRRGIAASLGNLGNVASRQQDDPKAHALYQEALAINRDMGDRQWEAINLVNLGSLLLRQGDAAQARECFAQSLQIRRELGDRWGIANSLQSLARTACAQGNHPMSARLYGAAEALRVAIRAALEPAEKAEDERYLCALRAALGESDISSAWAEGGAWTPDQAVDYALGTGEKPG